MSAPAQRSREWIVTASPEEITAAYNAGQLQVALGRAVDAPVQRTDAWLTAATPDEIAAAYEAGELATLQGQELDQFGKVVGR